jgi:hypothetical protein
MAMPPHIDTLRSLLSSGLRPEDALVRLRDSGVSAIACVKTLSELQAIEGAEAKGLVDWLNSIPTPAEAAEQTRRWEDEHPGEAVAAAFAALGDPPVRVDTIDNQGSWFSLVTARDGIVSWRFVHERSVWTVDASPVWSPDEPFDVDLLARYFLGRGLPRFDMSVVDRMRISVADLVAEVGLVRRPVRDGFRQGTWAATGAQLRRLRHQRDLAKSAARTLLSPPVGPSRQD